LSGCLFRLTGRETGSRWGGYLFAAFASRRSLHRVITLDGAHGLAGPDWGGIVWAAYDDAPAVARGLACIADGTPALGAGDEPAYEWA